MPSSQLDRRELRMPSLPYRRRNLVVLSDEHNKTTLATGCVAFLVFVAFLAAYAGQSLQPETGPANNWGLSDKIAVIAAVVGFGQFVALFGTAYVMRASAQRQLRAYVHVSYSQRVSSPQAAPETRRLGARWLRRMRHPQSTAERPSGATLRADAAEGRIAGGERLGVRDRPFCGLRGGTLGDTRHGET